MLGTAECFFSNELMAAITVVAMAFILGIWAAM